MKELIEKMKAVVSEMEEKWASLEEVRDAKVDETADPVVAEPEPQVAAPAEPAAPVTDAQNG